MNAEYDALLIPALGGAKNSSNVSAWGTAFAVVLIAVIAVIPRRENLTLGEAKAKPPTSRATGGKPPHGDYNTNNRFLVATRLWEFVKIGSSKLTRRRR